MQAGLTTRRLTLREIFPSGSFDSGESYVRTIDRLAIVDETRCLLSAAR
jgi:hypothetical protein